LTKWAAVRKEIKKDGHEAAAELRKDAHEAKKQMHSSTRAARN
jgi:hypothetical protein